jgi:uncharacterized protein YndB with AHSA1/START domain
MNGFVCKTVVLAPPEKVFRFATDFANAAQYIPSIVRTELLTEGPVGVGTRFKETRKMMGREATEQMEVMEFEHLKRYVLGAESHGCRFRSEFRFRPIEGGTEVELDFQGEPLTAAAKLMAVVFKPMISAAAKECQKDLEHLKAAIERS